MSYQITLWCVFLSLCLTFPTVLPCLTSVAPVPRTEMARFRRSDLCPLCVCVRATYLGRGPQGFQHAYDQCNTHKGAVKSFLVTLEEWAAVLDVRALLACLNSCC